MECLHCVTKRDPNGQKSSYLIFERLICRYCEFLSNQLLKKTIINCYFNNQLNEALLYIVLI